MTEGDLDVRLEAFGYLTIILHVQETASRGILTHTPRLIEGDTIVILTGLISLTGTEDDTIDVVFYLKRKLVISYLTLSIDAFNTFK